MLKLSIKPGEYINIGDDVRVIYSGGSEGNIHLLIDAPRELNIEEARFLQEIPPIRIRKSPAIYLHIMRNVDFPLKHFPKSAGL